MDVRSIEPISIPPCESADGGASLWKRAFDVVVSVIFVIVFAPAIALLAILVMLDGGPALYFQKRVGQNGLVFRCWKFRTMVVDADRALTEILATDPALLLEYKTFWKLRDDPRVTKIGRFLRRTSLDELPQIFNVIRGEMSLVGPRPRSIDEIRFFESMTPEFNNVYKSVKPGLTGLWQISGRNKLTLKEKGYLDIQYTKNWSFSNDLMIILLTVPIVVSGEGAF